jgi:hypothetical protein
MPALRRTVVLFVALLGLVACSDDDAPEPVGIMWGSGASGAFVEDTIPLLAFFRDRDGNSMGDPLTGVSWTSSNPAVLAIDGDTIATALDTGAAVLRASISAPAYAVDVPFRVIPRWQGRLVWSRSPEDGGQPRLAVQEYPGHPWRQLADLGYPGDGTGDPHLSGDGRYVAATAVRPSSPFAPATIFVVDFVSGTVNAPVDALPGHQLSPAWCPGDTLLAFLMGTATGWEVFTVRLDGTDVRQRTQLEQSVPPFFDVTPEGTIVLPLRTTAGTHDLFEVTLTGDTVARLTDTPNQEEASPSASPDGAAIAYVSTTVTSGGQAVDASRVWVVSRNGSNPRLVLPPRRVIGNGFSIYQASSQSPSWTPDGRFVLLSWSIDPAVQTGGSGTSLPEVYAVRVADGLAIRLTRYWRIDGQPFFR